MHVSCAPALAFKMSSELCLDFGFFLSYFQWNVSFHLIIFLLQILSKNNVFVLKLDRNALWRLLESWSVLRWIEKKVFKSSISFYPDFSLLLWSAQYQKNFENSQKIKNLTGAKIEGYLNFVEGNTKFQVCGLRYKMKQTSALGRVIEFDWNSFHDGPLHQLLKIFDIFSSQIDKDKSKKHKKVLQITLKRIRRRRNHNRKIIKLKQKK